MQNADNLPSEPMLFAHAFEKRLGIVWLGHSGLLTGDQMDVLRAMGTFGSQGKGFGTKTRLGFYAVSSSRT